MDIGTLTGEVNIENHLSGVFDVMTADVQKFAQSFADSLGPTGQIAMLATTAFVGMGVAVAALARRGAEVNQIADSMDNLSGSTAKTTAIIEAMAAGTLGTVNNFTLMKDASKLLSSHTLKNAEDFGTLTTAANVLANRGFGTTQDNIEKLSAALISGKTKTIQSTVGFIDAVTAQEKYAASIDTTRSKLTPQEKVLAIQIATMERLRSVVASAGEQHRNFSDEVSAAGTWVENLINKLGQEVDKSTAVSTAIHTIEDALVSAFGGNSSAIIEKLMGVINGFADAVTGAIGWIKKLVGLSGELSYYMAALWDILGSVWDIIKSVWNAIVPLVELMWKLDEPVRILATVNMVLLAGAFRVVAIVIDLTSKAFVWLVNKAIEFVDWVKAHIPFVDALGNAFAWLKEKVTGAGQSLGDHKTAVEGAAQSTADFVGPTLDMASGMDEEANAAARAAKEQDDHQKAIDKADKKIADYGKTLVPLTAIERDRVAELHKMGLNTADIAAKTDLSEVSISAYTDSLKKNKSQAEAHTKAVNDMVKSLTEGSKASNVTAEAFALLTKEQLRSEEVLRNLPAAMTKLAAEQGFLTAEQRDGLIAGVEYRDAMKEVEAQLLSSQGITKDYVDDQIALGHSTAEIGAEFNVSAKAIEDYIKQQDALKASTDKVTAMWREYNKAIAKTDTDRLNTQLDDIDAWYVAEYEAIQKAARVNIAAWDQLAPLNAAFYAKTNKARVDAQKEADARVRTATTSLNDFIESQTLSTTNYQVEKIWAAVNEQILADELAGKSNQELNDKRRALADAQTSALYVDNATLVSNSNASLQEVADKAATTYDAMAAQPEKYSAAALKAQAQIYWDAQHKADGMVDIYSKMADEISGVFSSIGSAIGGSTGQAISSMSGVVNLLKQAHDQSKLIGKDGNELGGKFGMMSTVFDSNAEAADRMGAAMAITENTISGIQDMKKGMDQRGRGNRALAGAAAGAKIGAVGGIYGMAIGAAAGAVIGLAKGDPAWAKATDEVARDTGLKISDEMGKTIATSAKTLGGRDVAIVENLAGIIKDAGGLTEKNIAGVQGKLRDVFSYIESGQLKVADGTKILDENWAQFAAAGTSASGVLNKGLTDIIGLAQQFGVESKAMTDYLGAQGSESATNFGNSLAVGANALLRQQEILDQLGTAGPEDIRALNEELQVQQGIIDATTIKTQEGADAMSAAVAADFSAMLNSGMSFSDAVAAITPSISALQVQMEAAGISGSDVFTLLESQVALYSDAIAGPALASVDSLTKGIVNLGNMGQLNQETFAGLADQIGVTFDSLVRQGYDGNTVMIGMKDSIQKVWEEQQQFGFVVDDSTQALIDQAVEQGLVGETHKSTTDQMLDASNRMVDVLEAMANTMGVVLPQQAQHGAKGVQTALDTIKAPALTVEVGYHDPGFHSQELPEGNEASHASTGGYVSSTGVQYLASGGEVFQPQGTDTVPAMLTPGERVLSVDQNQQYEQQGAGPSNQDVVDSINGLRQDMNGKMPRALARALHTGLVGLRTAS